MILVQDIRKSQNNVVGLKKDNQSLSDIWTGLFYIYEWGFAQYLHICERGFAQYLSLGYLLSIKKNTKNILIQSEEHKVSLYPMDFEEFLWAIGDEIIFVEGTTA